MGRPGQVCHPEPWDGAPQDDARVGVLRACLSSPLWKYLAADTHRRWAVGGCLGRGVRGQARGGKTVLWGLLVFTSGSPSLVWARVPLCFGCLFLVLWGKTSRTLFSYHPHPSFHSLWDLFCLCLLNSPLTPSGQIQAWLLCGPLLFAGRTCKSYSISYPGAPISAVGGVAGPSPA